MSSRRPSNSDSPGDASDRGRWSSRRKTEVVLRLLRGEDLDSLSRELTVTAATISLWRDHFLAGGQSSLKSREADDRDEEIRRLRAKVGEQAMEIELLYERARRAEGRDPFAPRRSRP